MLENLISALEESRLERLRWRVLSAFNALPCSEAAKDMSDTDCLIFGAHMLLDKRTREKEGSRDICENPEFHMERFEKLKRGDE